MRFQTKLDQYRRSLERKASRATVRIENPLPGGAQRLKGDCAFRHVARGAASWNADRTAIRFTEPAVQRVTRSFECDRARQAASRASDRAVHAIMGSYEQIKGVPVTKPTELTGPSAQRNYWNRKSVWTARRNSTPKPFGPAEKRK